MPPDACPDSLLKLPGLGPAMMRRLASIKITRTSELIETGAIKAYRRLLAAGVPANLNMLYALVGAVEHRPWTEVAQQDRSRLLTELTAAEEAERLFTRLKGDYPNCRS